MVAGEASGDLLASHLIGAVRQRMPDARFCGIGGPRMCADSFDAWWPSESPWPCEAMSRCCGTIAHRGHPARFARACSRILRTCSSGGCARFHLDLEDRSQAAWHRHGALHQSVDLGLAWRPDGKDPSRGRAHAVRVSVRGSLYRDAGVPATYVGHPLADVIPLEPDRAAARSGLWAGAW